MKKNEAYMTVGDLARKMGVTVRTLQYYDRRGLLKPSGETDGGRRLYSDKDLLKLYRILSFKSLGFSLAEISEMPERSDSPEAVAELLQEQADSLRQEIDSLQQSLLNIEKLREEVLRINEVDFKKYADIIVNLQMGNEYYQAVKFFDAETSDDLRSRFDRERAENFIERFQNLVAEISKALADGLQPASAEAEKLAERFWQLIKEFTEGDMSILSKLFEIFESTRASEETSSSRSRGNAEALAFIGEALQFYFSRNASDEETEMLAALFAAGDFNRGDTGQRDV